MNFVDSFFWQLVFQFLEPEDLVAVAGVCYSWWILVFRGSCRKLIMSKVRELDIADTENFYQKLPLQMFVCIRSLNLSGTTISSENFFYLRWLQNIFMFCSSFFVIIVWRMRC